MARTKSQGRNPRKPTPRRRTTAPRSARSGKVGDVVTKSAAEVHIQPYTEQQIRERAYYIYLSRQGGEGDALTDWLQAERELHEAARSGRS